MKERKPRLSERHIAAINLLGYAIILSDPRATTGVIGFMLSNYSRAFVLFLMIWAWAGVVYLLWRKVKPLAILLACMPILAYSVMGAWYVFMGENSPIAAMIFPLLGMVNVLWLIHTRIQSIAEGRYEDDSIPNRPQ